MKRYYSIVDGEMLSDIIERAGGYKENAYPLAGILLNEKAKEIQKKNSKEFITASLKHLLKALHLLQTDHQEIMKVLLK